MSIYDEMRNDIEVLYGRGECEYNVYSDMVDYIDEAETDYENLKKDRAQNAKLRDIVRMYASYVDDDRCEGCVYKRACNEGMVEECWQLTEIRKAEKEARELGIEI